MPAGGVRRWQNKPVWQIKNAEVVVQAPKGWQVRSNLCDARLAPRVSTYTVTDGMAAAAMERFWLPHRIWSPSLFPCCGAQRSTAPPPSTVFVQVAAPLLNKQSHGFSGMHMGKRATVMDCVIETTAHKQCNRNNLRYAKPPSSHTSGIGWK